MKAELTTKQVGILVSLSIISLKLIIFPAVMSSFSGNNVYISVALALFVDLIFLIVIMAIMRANPNMTFFEIIEKGLGKIVAKIVAFALFVYFFMKLMLTIKETHNYLYELLFESFSWYFYIFPVLALIFYMVKMGLNPLARSVEFLFTTMMIGAIISVFLPVKTVQFDNLLPILPNGIRPILDCLFNTNFAFGDYFVLALFMGRFKFENKSNAKIMKYILVTDLIIVLFYMLFVCVFGNLAISESLAINDIPIFANKPSINGRLEWIGSIVWSVILIFQAAIMLFCCKECFNYTFSFINPNINLAIIAVGLFALLAYLYLSLAMALKIIFSMSAVITSLSIQVGIPLLLIIASIICARRKKQWKKFGIK